MKRYQLYFNPNSVAVIDEMEKLSDISRSKIIRMAMEYLGDLFTRVVSLKTNKDPKYSALDKMVGAISIPPSKTNLASDIDRDIYSDEL